MDAGNFSRNCLVSIVISRIISRTKNVFLGFATHFSKQFLAPYWAISVVIKLWSVKWN